MRVEARMFLGLTAFLFIIAAIYGFWSKDPIGATALVLSGGLTGLCGSYFYFISRRIDERPEDRADAEISEGAGELGFFSPGSYWPFGVALAAMIMGLGLAFWYYWLIALGALCVLVTVAGMLFEYYTGNSESH